MKQVLTANITYWCSLLIAVIMASTSANAQITLDSASYTITLPHTDTLRISKYNATIPALPQGPDQTWDLSTFADSADLLPIYRVPATGYSFADSTITSFIGFPLLCNRNYTLTSSGVYNTSVTYAAGSHDIFGRTGGASDTLYFLQGTSRLSTVLPSPTLSLTYGRSWICNTLNDFSFEISVALHGYVRSHCIRRSYRSIHDTTAGYGVLAVKDHSGSRSDVWPVLQVTEREVVIDSYFLAGAPMLGSLMSALGLAQGKVDTLFTQLYYRIGELTPLAKVWYTDGTYSRAYRATTHTQRLDRTATPTKTSRRSVSVFPNPVVNGWVAISGLPLGNYHYSIYTPLGQQIAYGSVSAVGSAITLTFPQLPLGPYYLNLTSHNDHTLYQCTLLIP